MYALLEFWHVNLLRKNKKEEKVLGRIDSINMGLNSRDRRQVKAFVKGTDSIWHGIEC